MHPDTHELAIAVTLSLQYLLALSIEGREDRIPGMLNLLHEINSQFEKNRAAKPPIAAQLCAQHLAAFETLLLNRLDAGTLRGSPPAIDR